MAFLDCNAHQVVITKRVKPCDDPECVRCKVADKYGLNNVELAIIDKLCDGLSDKDIAEDLSIVPSSVKSYQWRIRNKLGVDNRIGVVTWAFRSRLVKI